MKQVYDYKKGQWIWVKDEGELAEERMQEEIECARKRRIEEEERRYYGDEYDSVKNKHYVYFQQ